MENEKDPIDAVHLEIPLLIRLFEYAREDATSDKDLHVVAENLLKCSKGCEGKPLSMECYDKVVPEKKDLKTEAKELSLLEIEKSLQELLKAGEAAEEQGKGSDAMNHYRRKAQVLSGQVKRSKSIPRNVSSLVDAASYQPDIGDAVYEIKRAIDEVNKLVKKETTVAGDVALKDVSLFSGKDKSKVNRIKTPYSESRKILSVAEAVAAVMEGESTLDISDKATTPEKFAKEFDDRAGTSFSLWGEEPQWKKLMDAWDNGQKVTIVYSEKEKKEKEAKGFKLVASGSGGPGNEEYILVHPHSKYGK